MIQYDYSLHFKWSAYRKKITYKQYLYWKLIENIFQECDCYTSIWKIVACIQGVGMKDVLNIGSNINLSSGRMTMTTTRVYMYQRIKVEVGLCTILLCLTSVIHHRNSHLPHLAIPVLVAGFSFVSYACSETTSSPVKLMKTKLEWEVLQVKFKNSNYFLTERHCMLLTSMISSFWGFFNFAMLDAYEHYNYAKFNADCHTWVSERLSCVASSMRSGVDK